MRDTTSITKPDDETVILRGIPVPLASDVGGAFISDCSRNKERLFSDQRLCEKYGLSYSAWEEIAQNKAFRLAVDAEYERRIFNGDAAKEAAAKQFAEAPSVLGTILNDKSASPRHRIEAAKELRATANTGSEKTGDTTDRVHIVINLGADHPPVIIDKQVAPRAPDETKESFDAE